MLIQDNTPIIPVNYMRIFVMVAERIGANREQLLTDTGIEETLLAQPEAYMTFGQYKRLKQRARQLNLDPSFHFQYGTSINLTEHGKLGYAAFASASFEDALKKTVKYIKILNRMYSLDATIQGDVVALQMDTLMPVADLYIGEIEQISSAIFQAFKILPNDASNVFEVRFQYPEPAHVDVYRQYFGDICRFNCTANEIVFSIRELRKYWNYGDPIIEKIAQRNCEEALAQIEQDTSYAYRVREAIKTFGHRFPNQEQVADQLHIPTRTLARYLQKESTSFQEIADNVRRELAIQYLETTPWSIDEIADLTGYSSAANFGRAFKKWTGKNPSEYRSTTETLAEKDNCSGLI